MERGRVARLPKVLLHDHLDGGLRPRTVLELAARRGRALPAADVAGLGAWFARPCADLADFLARFDHLVPLLQRPPALRRVARECVEDLAVDGVVHAEVRYAPELSTHDGLSVEQVLEALAAGLADAGGEPTVNLVVCAMRDRPGSEAVVRAALHARDEGVPVVAVDLAGPEAAHPAADHAPALRLARDAGLGVTLHAGEEGGPDSIADALDQGAQRLGHGVRVIEDVAPDGTPGPVAARVLAGRVCLELCPASNVLTGVAATPDQHPIERLRRLGYPVTVSTDDRLLCDTTLTDQLMALSDTFGWGPEQLLDVQLEAARSAFHLDADGRQRLADRIRDGVSALVG